MTLKDKIMWMRKKYSTALNAPAMHNILELPEEKRLKLQALYSKHWYIIPVIDEIEGPETNMGILYYELCYKLCLEDERAE